jgi:hypothetical protein
MFGSCVQKVILRVCVSLPTSICKIRSRFFACDPSHVNAEFGLFVLRYHESVVGLVAGPQNLEMKKGLRSYPKPLILLAGATRIELATSGVTGRRSNQAELRPRGRRNRI